MKEGDMAQASGYDFPVISGGNVQEAGASFAEARFGDVAVREEQVFEDIGGDWRNGEWGPPVGTVRLKQTPTTVRGRILVWASFVFDDGDTVEYGGLVPGDGTWVGKGRLGYRGGTGKFAAPRGELDVDSTNPKRWG
jgi:hypothetical protein